LARRLAYFSDFNLLDDTPKVDGFFPLYPREIEKVVSMMYASTNASFPRLADFLGVSHITAPGEFTEWQARSTFSPIVTAGQEPVFLDDTNTLQRLVEPGFDGAKMVFLPRETQSQVSAKGNAKAVITGQDFASHQIKLTVNAEAPCLVVIAQSYYHCWRAYVDDKSEPLLRANLAFQAVQVPAGTHEVRLAYEDMAFRYGAIVSILGGLTSIVFVVASRKDLQSATKRQ
jgi:hypothetical protein